MFEEKINKFIKQNSTWLIASIISITVVLFFVFLIMPNIESIKIKSNLIEEKKLDNEIEKSKIEKINSMQESLNNYESKKSELPAFYENNQIVDLVKKLESMAQETGNDITLKAVSDSKPKTESKETAKKKKKDEKIITDNLVYDKYISLDVSLKGSYPDLINFLEKIENSRMLINVLSIEIRKTSSSSNQLKSEEAIRTGDIFGSVNKASESEKVQQTNSSSEIIESILRVIVYQKS